MGPRIRAGVATDQWKVCVNDYVNSARFLFLSMSRSGFDPSCAIPVDTGGELLGGAHRLACAIAVDLPEVPVVRLDKVVWAPPWGEAWFEDHGMTPAGMQRLREDWEIMRA